MDTAHKPQIFNICSNMAGKSMALAHLKVIKILKGILQMLWGNIKTKKARIPEYDVWSTADTRV